MQRITIIGCSGAGKSTLARQLAEQLHLPVYHLDQLFWQPGWVKTPRDVWIERQRQFLASERWIVDGNFGSTLALRLQAADTIVLLDLPRLVCIQGVLQRWWRHRGQVRPDMGPGCPEKLEWSFLRWVWRYRVDELPDVLQQLRQHPGKEVIHLRSRAAVAAWLRSLDH